jgi:hypothetical protein
VAEPPEFYLVWSFEHGRWWRPSLRGYTENFEEAGHFTAEQALAICMKANFVGLNEAMVPIGEHTLEGERADHLRAKPFIPFPWPELLPIEAPEKLEALARYARVPLDYRWQSDPPGWARP